MHGAECMCDAVALSCNGQSFLRLDVLNCVGFGVDLVYVGLQGWLSDVQSEKSLSLGDCAQLNNILCRCFQSISTDKCVNELDLNREREFHQSIQPALAC